MIIRVINLHREEYMDFHADSYLPMFNKEKQVEITSVFGFSTPSMQIPIKMSPVINEYTTCADNDKFLFEIWVRDVSHYFFDTNAIVLANSDIVPIHAQRWSGLKIQW